MTQVLPRLSDVPVSGTGCGEAIGTTLVLGRRHCLRGPAEVPQFSTGPPPAALFECRPYSTTLTRGGPATYPAREYFAPQSKSAWRRWVPRPRRPTSRVLDRSESGHEPHRPATGVLVRM